MAAPKPASLQYREDGDILIRKGGNREEFPVILGLAQGYRMQRGVASVTGTGTVVTGLTTVVAVIVSAQSDLDGTTLAGVSATIGNQSGAPAAGSIIIKAWKITAADNAALIAATAAKSINWLAIGT